MAKMRKFQVADGLFFIEIPEAKLYIQCGCPADSVKHLMKRGLIVKMEKDGQEYESGPNAVLLSDVLVQSGSFANLAEFPVLQMLYRQCMIIPDHPNNTGVKPMLIGHPEQLDAQIQYIYRGNYGLISESEIVATGIPAETAREMMRLKLRFAFGKISPVDELLETRRVESEPVALRNGVVIRRMRLNVFEISYQGERVTVDLNLAPHQQYSAPYPLGYHQIERQYFGVIHSGEGDGWNVDRPCMSSILMFQGKIYLIDAGPNVLYSLTALGIGVNEVEGIFHTHAHDDHIAGFTMLMRSDHRIKYYSTPVVRASVARKLTALMSISEKNLFEYFEVHDLEMNVWNDIDGLEVKPAFSPHPVETTVLMFRTFWEDGYRSYAHFADIVSLNVLKNMITEDDNASGVSRRFYNGVKRIYLTRFDIKKLDVGGGMIHGDAEDFRDDPSEKLILSHTSTDLTNEQKEIGSGAPFGMVDVLIPTSRNYLHSYAKNYLRSYFPTAPEHEHRILLNNDIVPFNPQSILLKNGNLAEEIYLILTGNVERIFSEQQIHSILSAGALIGEMSALENAPSNGTYRAANHVQALRLPRNLYIKFVKRNKLYPEIKRLQKKREFIQRTWLFGEVVSYLTQTKLAKQMTCRSFAAGETFPAFAEPDIFMITSGKMERANDDGLVEALQPSHFFGEENVLFKRPGRYHIKVISDAEAFQIPGDMLLEIPVVRWKLFETYQKRSEIESSANNKV